MRGARDAGRLRVPFLSRLKPRGAVTGSRAEDFGGEPLSTGEERGGLKGRWGVEVPVPIGESSLQAIFPLGKAEQSLRLCSLADVG